MKINRKFVPLFYIHLGKCFFGKNRLSPENAIISGPRSKQQTLMYTANIWRLVAREQKHSDYIDSASKSLVMEICPHLVADVARFLSSKQPSQSKQTVKGQWVFI